MENSVINWIDSDINPWSEKIVKKAEEFKKLIRDSDTPQVRESYEKYQQQYGDIYSKKRIVEDIKKDRKYRAERLKILKRLEKLNSLIGDIN